MLRSIKAWFRSRRPFNRRWIRDPIERERHEQIVQDRLPVDPARRRAADRPPPADREDYPR
jgi:hypothetical protein